MSMLFIVMLGVQIIVAILLVVLILLQQGKGATAGASFGGGASENSFLELEAPQTFCLLQQRFSLQYFFLIVFF